MLTTKDFELKFISTAGATTIGTTATKVAKAINDSATCGPKLTATVIGGGGSLLATLGSAAANTILTMNGATESITITSTFSEAMGTVLLGGHEYDPDNNDTANLTATQANTTKSGATVTSVITVDAYANRFIVNTSKVKIADNKFYDVAGNDTGAIALSLAIAG